MTAQETSGRNFLPSDYAGFAYDAVWSYALALDQMTKQEMANLRSDDSLG